LDGLIDGEPVVGLIVGLGVVGGPGDFDGDRDGEMEGFHVVGVVGRLVGDLVGDFDGVDLDGDVDGMDVVGDGVVPPMHAQSNPLVILQNVLPSFSHDDEIVFIRANVPFTVGLAVVHEEHDNVG
jgi:hypothetical protein